MHYPARIALTLLTFFATQASLAAGDILTIPIRVPIAEGVNIGNNVLTECELERTLAKSLLSEAKGPYKKVVMKPVASAETPGHALDIKITAVLGTGGGRLHRPEIRDGSRDVVRRRQGAGNIYRPATN